MSPQISLCHATARLPRGWIDAYHAWMKSAAQPLNIEYILCVDRKDVLKLDYPPRAVTKDIDHTRALLTINEGRNCAVAAWNTAARKATGQVLLSVSDDWFPPQGWDAALLKAIPDLEYPYVVDVDNQDNSYPLLPFSILTRPYLDKLCSQYGYHGFFYPEYFGMMADAEFTDLARQDRVVVNARYLKFEHRNPEIGGTGPNCGTIPWDDVYHWQRRPEATQRGKDVYVKRVHELGIKNPGFVPLEYLKREEKGSKKETEAVSSYGGSAYLGTRVARIHAD